MLTVEDSGVGIPEEKLERIFEEYYQVGPEGTRRLGVGLGLAIVREVARILGYSVSVFSSTGRGTEVQVRVPGQRVISTPAPAPAAQKESTRVTSAAPRGRIVLLEDNEAVRRATELFLTLDGHEIQSAATVAEAEHLLSSMRLGDILITDYHLGEGITGLEVVEQLRLKHGRSIPAILLSGDLQSMMRGVKNPLPNARFLSKPVDTRALTQAIDELCATPRGPV
jgi:CheY-like chemotaxis protein